MFEDKIDRDALDKMPDEYKELLSRVLTIQADCEIGGPHLYIEKMLPSAPTKLNQLIVARTAAEEMDHYRKIALLAGEIGVDTSFSRGQEADLVAQTIVVIAGASDPTSTVVDRDRRLGPLLADAARDRRPSERPASRPHHSLRC